MTRAHGSAGFVPRVSRDDAHQAVRAALRAHLRGGAWTVKTLANASGVPDRVIESATCEVGSQDWRPMPFDRILSIAAVLGAEFTAACLRPAQHGAFELPDAAALDPAAIMIEVTRRANEVVTLAADNDLCPDDLVRMEPIAHAKIDLGIRMLAARWAHAARMALAA